MIHGILVRWKDCVTDRQRQADRVEALFDRAVEAPGIHRVWVRRGCIAAHNRCDLMICMEMERWALEEFDAGQLHQQWKDSFGPIIAQKVIFDWEETGEAR